MELLGKRAFSVRDRQQGLTRLYCVSGGYVQFRDLTGSRRLDL